jgi:K+-transporting ATPase c subunit
MENRIVGYLVMNTFGDPSVSVLRLNLALDALAPKVH